MNSSGQPDYDAIKSIISSLSFTALEKLAEGPFPFKEEGEECRACSVLDPMERHAGAVRLSEWHDLIGKGFSVLAAVVEGEYKADVEEELCNEVADIINELSYARCMVIYALATAELEFRRRANVEDGLDADGEPPDDRDAGERRADEEAEAAEQRLDAEKVGDLPPSYPPAVDQA